MARTLPGLLANGDRITVRQLLNHTSGLYDYTQDPTLLAGIVRNQIFTPVELVAIAEKHPIVLPQAPPGPTPIPTTSSPGCSSKPSPVTG